MAENKNIFCASDPSKLSNALWNALSANGRFDFSNNIVFLPSRRAVRVVEKMLVQKGTGGAMLLPRLVALGEGAEDDDLDVDDAADNIVSTMERIIVLAKMLTMQTGGGISGALPVARDLIRMMDYLENERGEDDPVQATVNWSGLIGDKYAHHFTDKARFMDVAFGLLPAVFPNKITTSQKRNMDLRAWRNHLSGYDRVFVCGSTASVPATSDLMTHIASMPNGHIILPGKVKEFKVQSSEFNGLNDADPYSSIYKFLERIGVSSDDITLIDNGESAIDVFNNAFDNDALSRVPCSAQHPFVRIDAARESEEAEVVAEIAYAAAIQNKSVLIVTPDVAANMRIAESLCLRGIPFDTSGGQSGASTRLGRFILEEIKRQTDNKSNMPDIAAMYQADKDLASAVRHLIRGADDRRMLTFDYMNDASIPVWNAISDVSDILFRHKLDMTSVDILAILNDVLSAVSLRPPLNDDVMVSVLGTMEARMQSADVVILTGLNEGMFPAPGYENPWLPRRVSDELGLPPPTRKVSLMALDFMVLSCGAEVYWTRSKMSGSGDTTESRFLSRVSVAAAKTADGSVQIHPGDGWLARARARDDVPPDPLGAAAPRPPAVYDPVYVTELEQLIHNPFAFYCRHILRLYPENDPWDAVGPKEFGTMVHAAAQELDEKKEITAADVVRLLDAKAREILAQGSVLFHFWHKRFLDMAPFIAETINASHAPDVLWSGVETLGQTEIAGRIVKAKADKAWVRGTFGVALDIKTGGAPNKRQLTLGNMPQLPLEAHMLATGGFLYSGPVSSVAVQFLQLRNKDTRIIEYADKDVEIMIRNSIQKISELFGRYSRDFEPYDYYETGDAKYKMYDDLARKE